MCMCVCHCTRMLCGTCKKRYQCVRVCVCVCVSELVYLAAYPVGTCKSGEEERQSEAIGEGAVSTDDTWRRGRGRGRGRRRGKRTKGP